MPNILAFDTAPVFASFRERRSSYEQVAVCPELDILDMLWVAKPVDERRQRIQYQIKWFKSIEGQVHTSANPHKLQVRLILDKVLKEVETVNEQLKAKQDKFEGINSDYVTRVARRLATWLWSHANPAHLTTNLSYDRSIHMRAALPQGAVHITVLFSPDIDPFATVGLGDEEEANTVASVYDAQGNYLDGALGPLPQVLRQLADLLPASVSVLR